MSSFAPRFRPKSLFRWRDRRRQARTLRNNRGSQFRLELLEDRQLLSNFTVTDGADAPGSSTDVTLRYAITQAVEAGGSSTIGFSSTMENLTDNTITLSTNDPSGANVYGSTAFVIHDASITIDGAGDPGLVLSGGGAMRLFAVAGSDASLTLEDLTLSGGKAKGGAGGTSDCGGGGGGAAGLGGAVYNDDGAFTAEGVTFTNNTAQGGAGGSVGFDGAGFGGGGGGLGGSGQSGGPPSGNHATGGTFGGGHGGSSGVDGSAGGFGGGGGGGGASAAYGGDGGAGGFGGGGGGGAAYSQTRHGAAGGAFGFGGGAGGGGASYSNGGGGGGAGLGGGIFSNGGSVTLVNDTFTGNTAVGGTGGLASGSSSSPGEPGQGLGGAVFVRNTNLQAVFDTFSGDTVTNGGASAGSASEVYALGDGTGSTFIATFVDDILGQSSDSSVSDFVAEGINDGEAPNRTGSSNDLVTNNPTNGTGLTGTDIIGGDPMLGALASNGGPTQTLALQAGNPAIAAGVPADFPGTDTTIGTDQRGVIRTSSPDIGAYEIAPTSYVVTDGTDGPGSSIDVTLRYAITQALAGGGNTTITFDPSLAGLTIALTSDDASGNHGYGPTAFVIDEPGITIDGSAAPGLTISGDGARRVFAVTKTASLTLEDLTVSDGLAQGTAGGLSDAGTAAGGGGGGGAGLGGGVFNDGGTFTADGVTFENDTATGGKGQAAAGGSDPTGGPGGSFGGIGGGDAGGTHSGGGLPGGAGGFGQGGGGGGAYQSHGGPGAGGSGGFGGGGGGGGAGGGGAPGGDAGFGGGSGSLGGTTPADSGGGGGGGAGLGGGVFSNGGSIVLIDDTFTENSANGGGGGTGWDYGHNGSGLGGAVFVRNADLYATFVTFSGDTATNGDGSAGSASEVYVLGDGDGSAIPATFIDDILGGCNCSQTSEFVASTYNGGTAPDLSGSSNDLVSSNPTDGTGLPILAAVGSGDLMVAPLANNGGPTQTMAPIQGGPAVGAGVAADFPGTSTPITVDQTGAARTSPYTIGAVQGTVTADPTIVVCSGPLDLGTTTAGTAGTPESYSVSGYGLTADITVTAPTGVQLSDDGGTTWSTSLDLTETDGVVDTTTIDACISDSASAGSISDSIANTSIGATEQDVTVSGTVNGISISTSTLPLGTSTAGTAGATESYTVSGTGLTADILIDAPTGVELSDDGGSTWATSLDLAESGGTVDSTTIDARISASASVGGISGDITNTSTGDTEQDVSVSGTVNAVPSIAISTGTLELGTTTAGTPGSTEDYTVSGTGLTADITIDAPAGVELSDDGGSTWNASLDLSETDGTVDTTTIDARIGASASVGSISGDITNTSTGATEQDVSVSGTVNAVPSISISTGTLALGTTTTGTAGTTGSYMVSGTGLTADILIDAPTGVELSDDGGTTWHASLDLTETAGTVDTTTIDARIGASASVGGITGDITNTSTGATEQDVSVTGMVNSAVATYTVTDAVDSAGSSSDVTLRYAITQALLGDRDADITFDPSLAGLTITLTSDDASGDDGFGPTAFVIDDSGVTITIDGAAAPGLVLSGDGARRIFAVTSGAGVTLEDLTVTDGLAQGGAGGNSGLGGAGGGAAGLGGAVYDDGGSFTAEGVTFTNNTAHGGAGGNARNGSSAPGAGGGGLGGAGQSTGAGGPDGGGPGGAGSSGPGGAGGFGGGGGGGGRAHRSEGYEAGIGGAGGFGGGGGGGGGWDTITYNNGAGGFGGGMGRAGIYSEAGGGGGGAGLGGALFSNGGSITLVDDTFTANAAIGGAAGSGGIVRSSSPGSPSGSGGSDAHNPSEGSGYGGAIFVRNGALSLVLDTFSGDTVTDGDGDAGNASEVYVLGDGNGSADAATLIDDILGQGGDSKVDDFVASTFDGGTAPDLSGSSNDLVTRNPSGSTGLPVAATGDPMLGPLASNGGPTQTMALQAGSPAIGAGISADYPGTDTPITIDQSGAALASPPNLGALQYVPPAVTISTGTLDLGSTIEGTAGSTYSYTVSGSNLTADIIVTAPTGVELSDDGGTTWSTSLDLTETDGTVGSTTIDARISASASVGGISGEITNSSTDATDEDVTVSGTVNAVPTIDISTGGLDLGTTTAGTAGSTESYTVSGSGLTADILIVAPTGVELSDDGGSTWQTELDLTETEGTVATTTIDARISASAAIGGISGEITNSSTGATEQDVNVSGTVNAVPTITVSTFNVNLGTTTAGTAGSTESYTVSGSGLTADILIVAPTGVELSDDGGSTWGSSLDLTETDGSVVSTTIDARISASASVGGINGAIANASTGATVQDVSVSGTVNPASVTYIVTDGSDTGGSSDDVTLRYAITQAVASHEDATIEFADSMINLTDGTITLTTDDPSLANVYGPTAFVIDGASIAIDGSGHPGLAISGGGAMRLFAVTSTGSLTLEDLTVTGGLAQGGAGGISRWGGSGGGAAGLGGAVYDDDGSFTAQGVTFTNNTAQGGAGGSISEFDDGTGAGGGGLGGPGQSTGQGGLSGGGPGGGGAGGFGGGGGGGNSSFHGGIVLGGGGGFGGGGGGGGSGDEVPGGSGGFGGGHGGFGTYYGGGGGGGAGLGGALFSNGGSVTLVDDTFTANAADGGAGGTGSLDGGNGSGYGGAVFIRNGTLSATFDTFSGDTVTNGDNSDGSASEVYVLGDGNGSAFAATLIDDILGQSGDSTASDFVAAAINGGTAPDLTASSNDLVTNNPDDGSGLTGTDIIGGDPKLAAPASNGGPTQTLALQAGSPAIGAGVTAVFPGTDTEITTDQSGAALNSPPDLGALQYVHSIIPTVTISTGSLNLGTTTAGTAGSIETYTVGGSGLTADILIDAPTGVELSVDGGMTWHTSLELGESGGAVDTTTIEARIAASASAGGISGDITNTSTGATEQDVGVSGTVNAVPTITVSTGSLNLGTTTAGTAGSTESYTVSGTGLTADILIDAPTGVELSDDGGTTWQAVLDLTESGGAVDTTTIDVRIAATASAGTISGQITSTSTGATERDVSVSGTVDAVPTLIISTGTLALGTTSAGTAGTTESYTVAGSGLTADILIDAPSGVELSDDGGSTWSTGLDLAETDGTVDTTTIDVRIAATASAGGISGEISNTSTGAIPQGVSVSGTVNAVPTITISSVILTLGTTSAGTAGTTESYTVAGSGLTADILIDAPSGVELSDDGGSTWSTGLDLAETDGTVDTTTIDVRIAATASAGIVSGVITNTSTGATVQNVTVSGMVNAVPTITISTGSLALGTTTTGTAGSIESYTVGGAGLTTSLLIGAPAGIELSDDGGQTWSTILTLPESGGAVATTTIDVRMSASAAAGTIGGSIANSGGGAVVQDVAVGGTVQASSEAGVVVPSSPQTFYGESVTLTATFQATANGSAPMTGTVAFYDGSVFLGTAVLVPSGSGNPTAAILPLGYEAGTVFGSATLTTSALGIGDHVITAVYSGNAAYAGATSTTPVSVQVAPAQTSTTLAVSTTAQGTILTATVAVTSPGNPPIGGTVSFFDGPSLLGTAPVLDGVATLNAGVLPAGNHAFSAVYSGGGTASTSGSTMAVSTANPTVTRVVRYGSRHQPTYLVLYFSQKLDVGRAQDVANYSLLGPLKRRPDRRRSIRISAAVYDLASNSVTLVLSGQWKVNRHWTLTAIGTSPTGLTSASGIPLDGAANGRPVTQTTAGSNYVARVGSKNFGGSASKLPTAGLVAGATTAVATPVSDVQAPKSSFLGALARLWRR